MTRKFLKEMARVFVFSFLGAFLPLLSGILVAPDWNAGKAALLSALVASVATAVKALTDALTKGVTPVPGIGILPPSVKN